MAEILKERFGASLKGDSVVAGDLNSGPDAPELRPLTTLGLDNDVDTRLPEKGRWTHYYKRGKQAEQLDYLLLSPGLSTKTGLPLLTSSAGA